MKQKPIQLNKANESKLTAHTELGINNNLDTVKSNFRS